MATIEKRTITDKKLALWRKSYIETGRLEDTNWHTWLHMGTEKLQRGACGDGRCEGY